MPRPARTAAIEVVSFNRGRYAALDAHRRRTRCRATWPQRDAVARRRRRACDAIFHNAAKAGAWGSYESYHLANVVGTQNVIDACRAHGIGRLVYTSTPSVTHRATHPVEGGTADTVPYGEHLKAPYAATKTDRRESACSPPTMPRWPPSRCARG